MLQDQRLQIACKYQFVNKEKLKQRAQQTRQFQQNVVNNSNK